MDGFRTRVVGVTFYPGYPNNLGDLARRCAIDGPVPATLVREFDNRHDLNAVLVEIEGRPVGHLSRDLAGLVAPEMDNGVPWTAEALYVAVDLEHKKKPGLEIRVYREESAHADA